MELDKRYSAQLKSEARTLREAVFCRIVTQAVQEPEAVAISYNISGLRTVRVPVVPLHPAALLAAIDASEYHSDFSALPFISTSKIVDPELPTYLQDLAAIIAKECRGAIADEYYPRPMGVDACTPEHVQKVMESLNREMLREATRRTKTWVPYTDLPPDRQVALAERRRMWLAKFGITTETWPSGVFSLWDVSNEPLPDLIGGKMATA